MASAVLASVTCVLSSLTTECAHSSQPPWAVHPRNAVAVICNDESPLLVRNDPWRRPFASACRPQVSAFFVAFLEPWSTSGLGRRRSPHWQFVFRRDGHAKSPFLMDGFWRWSSLVCQRDPVAPRLLRNATFQTLPSFHIASNDHAVRPDANACRTSGCSKIFKSMSTSLTSFFLCSVPHLSLWSSIPTKPSNLANLLPSLPNLPFFIGRFSLLFFDAVSQNVIFVSSRRQKYKFYRTFRVLFSLCLNSGFEDVFMVFGRTVVLFGIIHFLPQTFCDKDRRYKLNPAF